MNATKFKGSTPLIGAIHDHIALCQNVSRRLLWMADVLDAVGSDRLADELTEIADKLPASAKLISGEFSLDQNRKLSDSKEFTGLLLKATIDGLIAPRKRG